MRTNGNGFYQGKVAFVTGAGSGIGRATALAALGAGCRPMIVVTGANNELSRRELQRGLK